ncbi:hypothetical protein [Aliarcobacter cibarius]|uniref:Uncharacterized protein n=1 Tax=Aliarcobacter cibarius TaxID=255507 RepID=A0ABY2V2A6_9BACT|nr:hypothetical protein [Aliarcobacter cibarius]TLS96820.1 hypothetical protein FE247_09340 [Aliarcobacter cibarius]TLS97325.1 hypothetical protein FE245_09350 [Aliarcobacter cibarius]
MNQELLKKYLDEADEIYLSKKLKQAEYASNILFTSKNATYTLEEVNEYKRKTKPRLINNEISSIHRELDKKIAIFQIRTINPKFNIPSNVLIEKEIDRHLKLQYQQFNEYFDYMNNFKVKGNRLNKQYVRIYELTEALNIHLNSIDILQSKEHLEHYLKSVIFSKMKNSIGKIELIITEYTLKHLKKLFNNFQIRVKNSYKKLSLKQYGKYFYIEGIGCKLEEGIYFKLFTKEEDSKLKLIKYFYKNILEERYTQKPTREHLVFEKLKMRIKQFSKDFFNAKIEKHILYRTNNKLFLMAKNKNKEIQLSPTQKDKKSFLYYTASLFRRHILRREKNEEIDFIYLCKKDKWIDILNLKTYEKECFLESSLNNVDIYRQKDYLSKFDKNIKQFFKELSIKKIQTRGNFIKNYKLKEFYLEGFVSKLWVQYLEYLYYGVRKIGLVEYMEELICNFKLIQHKICIYKRF